MELLGDQTDDSIRQVQATREALAHRDRLHAARQAALADADNRRASVMKLTGVAGKEAAKDKAEEEARQVSEVKASASQEVEDFG